MPTLPEIIRSRSRKGWRDFVFQKLSELRNWIQEHGEKGAILTFALGILLVMFFRFFLFLVAVGIIAGYVIWYIAPADSE